MQTIRAAVLCIALAASAARADGIQTLEAVVVTATGSEGLIGEAASASEGTVGARQLENRPLLRPGEVLEAVPGLVISQHSGEGKANQYYLRGFNLDHGTDFATTLLGMPVNLPTHAHGQGYSDLHVLIPELIDRMQYRKGPYAADAGDFATAGSASIDYARKLDAPFAEVSLGRHGYRRALAAGSTAFADATLLHAIEWTRDDGPWTLPERLGKLNGVLRFSGGDEDNGWSIAALAYQAQWSATDQVPRRAVDAGLIGRFGNLDPTDGGKTRRASLSGEWSRRDAARWTRAYAYAIDYALTLWSNFTYCTLGCGTGDQFEQEDRRRIHGFGAARTWYGDWRARPVETTLGIQSRFDDIRNVGLYATSRRVRWGTVRQDRVRQGALGLYAESRVQWADRVRSVAGLRADTHAFDVHGDTAQNSGKRRAGIASPKFSLVFGPWDRTEYYLNVGYGFHSNDARGVTARVNADFRDPGFGSALEPTPPLIRAKGREIGLRSALAGGLHTSLALWRLDLASELVFAGDAGTTEPGFPSRRSGIEWASHWTPARALSVDADLAVSRGRYTDVPAGVVGDRIPGAVETTASFGITYAPRSGWSAGLRVRYLGPRPLAQDNSVRSRASSLVNARLAYRIDPRARLTLDILNALNAETSDIDYFYASQLRGEPVAVNDVHSHPAVPRMVRLSLRLNH